MDITACLADGMAFLAAMGMPIQNPPQIDKVAGITYMVDGKRVDLRAKYENGVLTYNFRQAQCPEIVHELVHHKQWERDGSATTAEEWDRREVEANAITMAYRKRDE